MKRSEVKELPSKTDVELKTMVGQTRVEVSRIMVEVHSRRMIDVSLAGKKKKDIARMLTELQARKLAKETTV
jgi:ribosomal protein L29